MVLGGMEMETVFWPDQDQLQVAGTGLRVRHTEEGLLEGRIETNYFRLQYGESMPRLVRYVRHYGIIYNKYVNVLYRVVFCPGWRLSELEAASTRDHDQAWTDSVLAQVSNIKLREET